MRTFETTLHQFGRAQNGATKSKSYFKSGRIRSWDKKRRYL